MDKYIFYFKDRITKNITMSLKNCLRFAYFENSFIFDIQQYPKYFCWIFESIFSFVKKIIIIVASVIFIYLIK